MYFPTVIVCNINQIKKSLFRSLSPDDLDQVSDAFCTVYCRGRDVAFLSRLPRGAAPTALPGTTGTTRTARAGSETCSTGSSTQGWTGI